MKATKERSLGVVVFDHDTQKLKQTKQTFKESQEFVGGYIEFVGLDKAIAMYVNDSRYEVVHLPTLVEIPPRAGRPPVVCRIFGNIVFVGYNRTTGDVCDLTKEEMKHISVRFDLDFLIRGGE